MVKGNEGHYSIVKILKSNYSLSNRTLKKLTSVVLPSRETLKSLM